MIDYYKEGQSPQLSTKADAGTEAEIKLEGGLVCPCCYRLITESSKVISLEQSAGIKTRTYLGWCVNCNIGFEVEQFERDGVWFIRRFRHYRLIADNVIKLYKVEQNWQLVNELPPAKTETGTVAAGPGNDLNSIIHVVESLKNILESVTQTADTLLQILKKQK